MSEAPVIIKHPATPNLEWSPTLCDGKRVSQADADAAIAALGEGWRRPTAHELYSLVDHAKEEPAIDTDLFPDTQCEPYWTGTECAWDSDARWVVIFNFGFVLNSFVSYYACVRACRASQSL